MRKQAAACLAAFLVLAVAAPVSAAAPPGSGPPTVQVIGDYSYADDSCGPSFDVVVHQSTSYWYHPDDPEGAWGPMKQSGNAEAVWSNPVNGKWIEIHYGGEAQWWIPLEWSPERQIQVIGRTLTEDEELDRYHMGVHWGARSSDGRTLAFHAYGESNIYVWNNVTEEVVWSKFPYNVGGGSWQRQPFDYSTLCDAIVSWLT